MAIFVLYNFLCYCFLSHLLIHPSVSGSFTRELWSWSPLKFSTAPWLAYHLCPSVFKIPSTSIMQHNNDGGINIYLAEALKISEAEPMQVSSANFICSFCLSWVTVMQKRLNVQLKKTGIIILISKRKLWKKEWMLLNLNRLPWPPSYIKFYRILGGHVNVTNWLWDWHLCKDCPQIFNLLLACEF